MGLRAALEVLWEADIRGAAAVAAARGSSDSGRDEEGDATELALATAQSILDAAEVTLPTGDLADGVYDLWGNYYQLAECVVCDPDNVIEEGDAGGEVVEEVKAGEEEEDEEAQRRRDEKGKGVVDRLSLVTAVIRLSDTGRDLKMKVGKEEGVGSVVRRLKEETGVSSFCRAFLPCNRWCVDLLTCLSLSIAFAALSHTPRLRRQNHARKYVAGCPRLGEGEGPERFCL